jgi:hypothetical protein
MISMDVEDERVLLVAAAVDTPAALRPLLRPLEPAIAGSGVNTAMGRLAPPMPPAPPSDSSQTYSRMTSPALSYSPSSCPAWSWAKMTVLAAPAPPALSNFLMRRSNVSWL